MALAPTWSQADRRVPSSGIVTSLVTTTTLSTATQSVTRVPPPGLPPPTGDHRYNLPQPGLPTPQPLMLPPQAEYLTLSRLLLLPPPPPPPSRRGVLLNYRLQAARERNPLGFQGLWPTISPQRSRSATPYQQQVQPPIQVSRPQEPIQQMEPTPRGSGDTQE